MADTASIKLHSFTTAPGHEPHWGDESADFRGDKFVGAAEGDNHHVLPIAGEIKNASESVIALVLAEGPKINAVFRQLAETEPDGIPGGRVGLRLGVWDAHA